MLDTTNTPNTFYLVKKFMELDLNKDNQLTFSELKSSFKDRIHPSKVIMNFFNFLD
jgi:hypothetical protein